MNPYHPIKVVCSVVVIGIIALVIVEMRRPEHIKPWWYDNSQVGWEHDHAVTPKGTDEISTYIISAHGINVVPWKREEFWAYIGDAKRRHQWMEDNTLLVRMESGEDSFFNGGDKLHPPLVGDPELPLTERLNPEDTGELTFKERGPSLIEVIESTGATVTRD